jgi:hypothetical protein
MAYLINHVSLYGIAVAFRNSGIMPEIIMGKKDTIADVKPFDAVNWLDRLLSKLLYWRAAIAAVFALQIALILTHVHWLDEWQAMQIAAQSPNISALLENLRYEGHPPLWYLLLQVWDIFLPFQWVLKAVLLPVAILTQSLILWRAPFTRGERLLITLGALMLFEYLTISRSQSLGVMTLIILMATWQQQRAPWIAIAILPMCDFLYGVLSCIAVLARWHDKKMWTLGLVFWLILGFAAAWTVRPAPDMFPAIFSTLDYELIQLAQAFGTNLIPIQANDWQLEWQSALPFSLGIVACPIFLWFAYHQTVQDRLSMFAMFGFIALIVVFSIAVYLLEFRHVSLAALFLILIKWRLAFNGALLDRWFRLWLLIGATCGLLVASHALRTPFDRAPDVARWIKDKGLEKKLWLVFPDSRGQSVSSINSMYFERVDQQCRTSFVRWNLQDPISGLEDFERRTSKIIQERGSGYLLSSVSLDKLPRKIAYRLAYFSAGHNGYSYYIYKIGSDAPETPNRAPLCVPNIKELGAEKSN